MSKATSNSQQALWIAIGQFMAFSIGIISPMVLSRYFDKGDYGTYKQVMYVYSTLITVFSFGLPRAYSYFIPRVAIEESKDVIRKISSLLFWVGVLVSAIFFFCSHQIASLLKNEELELALKLFAPTPLFLLPVMGLDCILSSYKKAQYIAVYSVLTKVFTLLCIIVPVIAFNGTYIHAIIGFDIASFLSYFLAIYLRDIPIKHVRSIKTDVSIKEILIFVWPLMVASIWITIYNSANQFFISRYFGNEVFAEFSNGFLSIPVIPMVINSVATVLLPVFSGMSVNNRDGIKEVWRSALSKSFRITYPIIVFCIVFAELVMTCFYGNQYKNSGMFFILKNIEDFFLLIPFYPILLALGKSKSYSNIHLFIALFIVVIDYLVIVLGGGVISICLAYLLSSFIKVVIQFSVICKSLKVSFSDLIPFKDMLKLMCCSFASTVVPYVCMRYYIDVNKYLLLIILGVLFVFCYYFICLVTKITYKDIVSSYIPNLKNSVLFKLIP